MNPGACCVPYRDVQAAEPFDPLLSAGILNIALRLEIQVEESFDAIGTIAGET